MLLEKIQEYIKKYDIKTFSRYSWVWIPVILSILNLENKKYNKKTLDILYHFFKLEKDDFYKQNLKKWYPKTKNILWNFIRIKRIAKNKDLDSLAREMKMEKRALARLEAWESLPSFNSYTIQKIIKTLEFDEKEIEIVRSFLYSCREVKKFLKKYDF